MIRHTPLDYVCNLGSFTPLKPCQIFTVLKLTKFYKTVKFFSGWVTLNTLAMVKYL